MSKYLPLLGSLNFEGVFAKTMLLLGFGLLFLFLIFIMLVMYYFFSYGIKADVFPLYGSGKEGSYSIGKKKKNRVKWVKKKKAWKPLWPLFNNKTIEPFTDEYLFPGKQIYVFDLNGKWMPGKVDIDYSAETLKAAIKPVPHYIRMWQSMMHQVNANDYASENFWDNNKMLIMTVIAVFICCLLAGVSVYLTYKYALGGQQNVQALASVVKDLAEATANGGVGPR